MHGDQESVVKLNANHSGVCKFGTSQVDQDNFKIARSNIKDLYKNAIKIRELRVIPSIVNQGVYANDDVLLQPSLARLKGERA
jgi:hypothetical protein